MLQHFVVAHFNLEKESVRVHMTSPPQHTHTTTNACTHWLEELCKKLHLSDT